MLPRNRRFTLTLLCASLWWLGGCSSSSSTSTLDGGTGGARTGGMTGQNGGSGGQAGSTSVPTGGAGGTTTSSGGAIGFGGAAGEGGHGGSAGATATGGAGNGGASGAAGGLATAGTNGSGGHAGAGGAAGMSGAGGSAGMAGAGGAAGAGGMTGAAGQAGMAGMAGGAGGSGTATTGQLQFTLSGYRKLDLLLMVDDSASMRPLQNKLANQLPMFIQQLKAFEGGLPDLHVAVISSSLGGGAFGDVPGCAPMTLPGDAGGKFQHKAGCGLLPGETFIKATTAGANNNFTGTLEDVFSCLAQIGDGGCGFEQPLQSIRVALTKASNPADLDNAGFLRPDAFLGVMMLTNEDDCSVPNDSQLFNTSVSSVNDSPPLGGLWSYRCNEFGHRCDQPLPHTAAGLPMTLTNCSSKEDTDGVYHLIPVADFVRYLDQLAPPERRFVSAIAAPPGPYQVHARTAQIAAGTEMQPEITHSCSASDGTYGDPAVRLQKLVTDTGGSFLPICADSFSGAMTAIGNKLARRIPGTCISWNIRSLANTTDPDCQVGLQKASGGAPTSVPLPYCLSGSANATATVPCWQVVSNTDCAAGRAVRLCYDSNCAGPTNPDSSDVVSVSCALAP